MDLMSPGILSDTRSFLLDHVFSGRGCPVRVPALPSSCAEWGSDTGKGPERDRALALRAQVCSSAPEG